jgi:soluble lytic murein transglycosylase-like protein
MSGIAARHGIGVSALAALNGISNPNRIMVGTELSLPGALPGAVSSSQQSYAPSSSGDVGALIARHAAGHGVSPSLARAIAWQESRWNQSARSSVGAVGVMQLMPATSDWFGPAVMGRPVDASDVDDNVETGVAYLGWLMRQSGDLRTTIGAYYQGLSSLRERGPYDDTTAYIDSVLSYMGRV